MFRLIDRQVPWPVLVLLAAIPRTLGAFLLPNAFGDAYVYIRTIGDWSTKLRAGSFAARDLYGFWLPLYQFIAALPNVIVRNGYYSGKLVAAIFGAGVCLLVYEATLQLTTNRVVALVAFLLIALNPLHIFYSASAMTDVPHACFVLGSLYFCLKQRWVLAAIMAAFAGLTRMESWMFIAIIPLIQFVRERRVSIVSLAVLGAPPLFWFYVSWNATGNWTASFAERRDYHDWLLNANPALTQFSFSRVTKDAAMLIVSTDVAVLVAALVAAWLLLSCWRQNNRNNAAVDGREILPALIFFFAFLAMIVAAYVTNTQPIIFPRYGLILFTLGIPILAWTLLDMNKRRPQLKWLLTISVVSICLFDAGVELVGSIGLLNQISVERKVADYLRDHFDPNSGGWIFCDDATVVALSGIPTQRFLTTADAPRDSPKFTAFLKSEKVEYLVFIKRQDSIAARTFPDAESQELNSFELAMHSFTDFWPTDIWLFQRQH